jgi:hypothetical protein
MINKSKKTIRNKMDKELGESVRGRGACQRCNKTADEVQLQCAHIFSRRYSKLRHDENNCLCLCAGCHFWAHQNPILFGLFVHKTLGSEKFQRLLDSRNSLDKIFLGDLK